MADHNESSKPDFPNITGPGVGPKITSIFDFNAEALGELMTYIAQNPPPIPITQIIGFTQSSFPASMVTPYAGSSAPTGWLICDGTAVSRTTYATLFTAIGTTYGTGDGSTTFNLPDLRGRMPVGKGSNALVSTLGNSDGVTETNRRPKHRHTAHTHTLGIRNSGVQGASAGIAMEAAGSTTTSSVDGGSGTSTDSLDAPAYLTLNFIIKT